MTLTSRALLAAIVLGLAACDSGDDTVADGGDGPQGKNDAGPGNVDGKDSGPSPDKDSGPMAPGYGEVLGRVFSADGLVPLEGVVISGPGDIRAKTDKQGKFVLEMLAAQRIGLRANLDGYAQAIEPVKVIAGATSTLELRMLPVTVSATLSASTGGTVRALSGAQVEIDSEAFVDASGKPVTGAVTIELTVLDPSTPEGLKAFPGDFSATNNDGESGQLETFVPMEITVKKGDATLDFAKGKGAEVSFPVPESLADKAPQTIALWSLDETTGAWVEEGTASLQRDEAGKLVYRGRIEHMSWWNCDAFIDNIACIRGCVELNGAPAPYAFTQAEGITYANIGESYAEHDGCFEGEVKGGAQLRVRALTQNAVSDWKVITAPAKGSACLDIGVLELVEHQSSSTCPAGTKKCNGTCVDLASNYDNCGACGDSCFGQLKGSQCIAGDCACSGDQKMCDGRYGPQCTDVQNDNEHCGACGKTCDKNKTCVAGKCVAPACGSGLTACGGECVDTTTSNAHCGACGNPCGQGKSCQANQCVALQCPAGSEACGNVCVAPKQCMGGGGPTGMAGSGAGAGASGTGGSAGSVAEEDGGVNMSEEDAGTTGAGGVGGSTGGPTAGTGGSAGTGGGADCDPNQLPCANQTQCIDEALICDEVQHCNDGSDEIGCPATCPDEQMACPGSGACIFPAQWCDSAPDCPGGFDEMSCGVGGTGSTGGAGAAGIGGGTGGTVSTGGVGGIDEDDAGVDFDAGAPGGTGGTGAAGGGSAGAGGTGGGEDECDPVSEVSCLDGNGTPICAMACDQASECSDGADEDVVSCCHLSDGMLCDVEAQLTCVPASSVCADDGAQCDDGRDEDVSDCCLHDGMAACRDDSACISPTSQCDQAQDCADGSDEDIQTCGCAEMDTMPCEDFTACIPVDAFCDMTTDCADGSDESLHMCP